MADKDTEVRKNDGGGTNSEAPFSQTHDCPRLQPVSNNLASTDYLYYQSTFLAGNKITDLQLASKPCSSTKTNVEPNY